MTLPKATLPGLALSVAVAVTPLPERVSVCGDPGALSAKLMLPVVPPAAAGANCTLHERLCPALIVAGSESPLIPNPLPDTVARLSTRSALPLFVRLTLCELFWPTVTLPKLTDAGDVAKPGCVPVPANAIASDEFEALLKTDRRPVTFPADCGPN